MPGLVQPDPADYLLANKVAESMSALREERNDVTGHRRNGLPVWDTESQQEDADRWRSGRSGPDTGTGITTCAGSVRSGSRTGRFTRKPMTLAGPVGTGVLRTGSPTKPKRRLLWPTRLST